MHRFIASLVLVWLVTAPNSDAVNCYFNVYSKGDLIAHLPTEADGSIKWDIDSLDEKTHHIEIQYWCDDGFKSEKAKYVIRKSADESYEGYEKGRIILKH